MDVRIVEALDVDGQFLEVKVLLQGFHHPVLGSFRVYLLLLLALVEHGVLRVSL